MLKKLFNKVVYATTKKPEHYVHVDTPKTLQDHRQVQYNNWCKGKGVYNGSYLPEDPKTLLKKGWQETTPSKNTSDDHRKYRRKSSGQIVMFDKDKFENGLLKEKHYHWDNPSPDRTTNKIKKATSQLDRYGNICGEHSEPSHLAPKDRDYNWIDRGRKGKKGGRK